MSDNPRKESRSAVAPSVDAKPYRIIAISLYSQELDVADGIASILQRGGWPKANRSLVVREALLCLEEVLAGKTPEEIFRHVADRHARRASRATADHTGTPRRRATDRFKSSS